MAHQKNDWKDSDSKDTLAIILLFIYYFIYLDRFRYLFYFIYFLTIFFSSGMHRQVKPPPTLLQNTSKK